MKTGGPIPPWLHRAEPVLVGRVNVELFESVYEAERRVRGENFRTPRGRRFLFYNVVSPLIVVVGVLGGLLLLESNYLTAMILLYGVPISQIVLVLKRGARSSHENILSPEVLGDLWIAGCGGSEAAAVTPLRIVRVVPRVALVIAVGLFFLSLGVLPSMDLQAWEVAAFALLILLCAHELIRWGMGVVAPMVLIHVARQQFIGSVSVFQMAMWFAIVFAVATTLIMINHMVIIIMGGALMQWGHSMSMAVLVYLAILTAILMAARRPAMPFVRRIQKEWLDQIDELFEIHMRKTVHNDPDAEREPPDDAEDAEEGDDSGEHDGADAGGDGHGQ